MLQEAIKVEKLKLTNDGKNRKRLLSLIFLVVISNIFSGLTSVITLFYYQIHGMIPDYVSSMNLYTSWVISVMVLITSVKMFKQRKPYTPFFAFWIMHLILFFYNRYLAVIYSTITPTKGFISIIIAGSWTMLIALYFFLC